MFLQKEADFWVFADSVVFRRVCVYSWFFGFAVFGRSLLQWVPSVETVLPATVFFGILFGKKRGFLFGATAFFYSNFFVWGGQGPWTLAQSLGAGLAGFLAGFVKKASYFNVFLASLLGTIVYESVVNVAWWLMFLGTMSLPLVFLTSLPFSLTHVLSTCGFCLAVPRTREAFLDFVETGRFR